MGIVYAHVYLTYEKWFKTNETNVKQMFSKITNCSNFRIELTESKTVCRKVNKTNKV